MHSILKATSKEGLINEREEEGKDGFQKLYTHRESEIERGEREGEERKIGRQVKRSESRCIGSIADKRLTKERLYAR